MMRTGAKVAVVAGIGLMVFGLFGGPEVTRAGAGMYFNDDERFLIAVGAVLVAAGLLRNRRPS